MAVITVYPQMSHVTCAAPHMVHNLSMRVRSRLKKRINSFGAKDIISLAEPLLNPTQLALLANAPTATVEVERVFSFLNKLLSKDHDFAPGNIFFFIKVQG